MDSIIFPTLMALTAALLVWGVAQVVAGFTDGEKRKLQRRLSTENKPGDGPSVARSITTQTEVTGLSGILTRQPLLDALRRKVIQAFPNMTLARFLAIAFGSALAVFTVAALIFDSLIVSGIAAALAAYIPFLVLSTKRAKRQQLLANQLPEALDFLSRILRAGHSFSTGLQMMGEELAQPLGAEFRRCYEQHSLGMTLDDALKDMALRIESTDFAFFVTAVLIQRQTGGDLSEVLNNISGMIRQRIRLQQHVKAKTAEGRFTGYILVAFPALMFVIAYSMNPGYAGVLLHTSEGLTMLFVAFGLQMLGLFAIRKITTVRV